MTISTEAVETFQVLNDNLTESTGTAERLRRGNAGAGADILRGHTKLPLPLFFRKAFACPRGISPVWNGSSPSETFRGPRGLR
jgi:hypothetical protein